MPFAQLIDTCFRTFGVPADYTPPGGAAVAVTVIVKSAVQEDPRLTRSGFVLDTSAQAAALVADVRKSEVAAPAKGDTLTIEGLVYPIQKQPALDDLRLVWSLVLGKPTAA